MWFVIDSEGGRTGHGHFSVVIVSVAPQSLFVLAHVLVISEVVDFVTCIVLHATLALRVVPTTRSKRSKIRF